MRADSQICIWIVLDIPESSLSFKGKDHTACPGHIVRIPDFFDIEQFSLLLKIRLLYLFQPGFSVFAGIEDLLRITPGQIQGIITDNLNTFQISVSFKSIVDKIIDPSVCQVVFRGIPVQSVFQIFLRAQAQIGQQIFQFCFRTVKILE